MARVFAQDRTSNEFYSYSVFVSLNSKIYDFIIRYSTPFQKFEFVINVKGSNISTRSYNRHLFTIVTPQSHSYIYNAKYNKFSKNITFRNIITRVVAGYVRSFFFDEMYIA